MAENTKQYKWITRLVTNLKHLLRDQTAFVAGDLLWYPVQVDKDETPPSQAPDAMVVLGRPDHDRGSYKQWEEEGIAPQVVFEILSPSNTAREMVDKQAFYAEHGASEIYFYDPESYSFWGLARQEPGGDLKPVLMLDEYWTSPLLKIRFAMFEDGLAVFYPNGEEFKDPEAFALGEAEAKAELEQAQAERDQLQAQLDQALSKIREAGLE